MKSVLMICRLYWPHGGGVERHVEKLSAELIGRGYKLRVITSQHNDDLPLKENRDGVEIFRIPYSALQSKMGVWKWVISHKTLFEQSHIVHVHDVFWWLVPLRLTKPFMQVFTTFHGYEGYGSPTMGALVHRKLVELLSIKTICVGDFMRKWYWAKPDKVIYGAADMKYNPGIKKDPDLAVFVGRLDKDTGIMTYLRAMKLLKENQPDLRLKIYGDGPQYTMAKDYVNKHKLAVSFHGWVLDVKYVYEQASYAFVSRYLSIIEAMQSDCLVVACYSNEIKKDYLEHHPQKDFMIIGGSADEIIEKICQLSNNNIKLMVKIAGDWSRRQTWSTITEIYENIWGR